MKQQNLIETNLGSTVIVEYTVFYSPTESYVSSVGRVTKNINRHGTDWSYKVHGARKEFFGYDSYESALNGLLKAAGLK